MQPPPPKPRDSQEVQDKYRRLEQKYFELEEKHKETLIQLNNLGEQNVKWRSERASLLDRIAELEGNPQVNPGAPIPAPPFSAFPRSLLSAHNQKLSINNLRQAIDKVEREDSDVDPFVLSRHIGPEARKGQEAELKEKQEEEAREVRRATRKELKVAQKSKDIGTPLTFALQQPNASVLVSSSGTRSRLEPPAPLSGDAEPASALSSGITLNSDEASLRLQANTESDGALSPAVNVAWMHPCSITAVDPITPVEFPVHSHRTIAPKGHCDYRPTSLPATPPSLGSVSPDGATKT
ncbi:uncharacterized protein LAESUDRAFT_762371 [Laetiporus sulphureus 93-53]|uniref:Uncharacterized protein n=1 Tax=Laetiporus sulphureus 93-53 TaxID=1314785 RepID=A0A165CJU2_9APHY|nr:uncharacterized protein LAESUDRAFT_762371 [Laetiporus sulphureus 93-53]KZT02943.1 hypothetical protein LAESUDRAFT_762371 [Laetiporus sulphureus 93-53]